MMLKLAIWAAVLLCQVKGLMVHPNAEEPIILSPTGEGDEAALLIVPGAYINAEFYQPLGEAIQAASSLKLWVGLVRPFPFDLPNPVSLIPDLDNTLQMMRDQGMTTNNIFLAGHSLGGTILQNHQWSEDNGILAWILLASYLPEGHLKNNTIPVMHISGDLDGLTRITRIMHEYRELQELIGEVVDVKLQKPVVVLEDINHMHFASGDPPPLVAADDILSPMPQEEAHALLAQHISSYITVISGLPTEEVTSARAMLRKDYEDTSIIMHPLLFLTDLSEGVEGSSSWTQMGQRIIATIAEQDQEFLQVNDTIYDTLGDFGHSKPHVELIGEVAVANTSTHVVQPGLLETMGDVAASELGVKFKSREAVMELLLPLGVEFGEYVTCKDVNKAAFELALNVSANISKARFEARGGSMKFHEDDVKATGSGWLYANLHYNITVNDVDITSPSLVTSVDVGLGLGGMHYCKLLPPSRALEFIMVDSLQHTQP